MDKQFLSEINQEKSKVESFQKETFESIRPDRTKYIWMIGVVLVALIGAYFLFNQKVTVVDMTGWTTTDAATWAGTNSVQLVSSSIYSESVAADSIISQSISAKTKISKDATVQITVSLGPDPTTKITIPEFDITWTKARLLTWLSDNAITNYAITTLVDGTRAANLYVSYAIPDTSASEFQRQDTINFVVTANLTTTTVTVSDLSGYSETQVSSWASTNGISVTYVKGFSSTVASGKVIAQSVVADASIVSGSSMTVTLSIGPSVTMINFSSYTLAVAQAWAQENSISLSTSTKYSSTVANGTAISQSVLKGKAVEQNSKVSVVYSLGSEVSLSNFTGKTLIEIQDYVNAQNILGASMKLNVTSQASDKISANHIIAQSIYDTKIPFNAAVDVIISSGKLVKVHDYSLFNSSDANTTYGQIVSDCELNGISCRITLQSVVDSTQVGKVLSQSVAADQIISKTQFVDVVIGK